MAENFAERIAEDWTEERSRGREAGCDCTAIGEIAKWNLDEQRFRWKLRRRAFDLDERMHAVVRVSSHLARRDETRDRINAGACTRGVEKNFFNRHYRSVFLRRDKLNRNREQ
jgi:hypothetical protein